MFQTLPETICSVYNKKIQYRFLVIPENEQAQGK